MQKWSARQDQQIGQIEKIVLNPFLKFLPLNMLNDYLPFFGIVIVVNHESTYYLDWDGTSAIIGIDQVVKPYQIYMVFHL